MAPTAQTSSSENATTPVRAPSRSRGAVTARQRVPSQRSTSGTDDGVSKLWTGAGYQEPAAHASEVEITLKAASD
jgi:hypothetical protein